MKLVKIIITAILSFLLSFLASFLLDWRWVDVELSRRLLVYFLMVIPISIGLMVIVEILKINRYES